MELKTPELMEVMTGSSRAEPPSACESLIFLTLGSPFINFQRASWKIFCVLSEEIKSPSSETFAVVVIDPVKS